MNLLTQVVCVSGVNRLTSVRGERVFLFKTLIINIPPGDFLGLHQRRSHSQKGYQPVPEHMVLWKRLELLARLWSWDGVCWVVDVLDCYPPRGE